MEFLHARAEAKHFRRPAVFRNWQDIKAKQFLILSKKNLMSER
jgi:hypothetical protein